MIARVSLDIALRKEFDYLIPSEIESTVEVGSRVKVPFGARQLLGSVTALSDSSSQPGLRAILKVVGGQALLTPKVLQLARWIADYYCCPLEIALKGVLPEAVRKEEAGWRERLTVQALPQSGSVPRLTKRQAEILERVRSTGEISLRQLIKQTSTTAATVRKLADLGLVALNSQISERDPYAREAVLATSPISLNPEQAAAFAKITTAIDRIGAARAQTATGSVFLLHGVTGSGKTEIYLQAIARA